MLKIRIILTSLILLLLVGVNLNARAGVDSTKLIQTSNKDQSEKESKDQESEETITHLDFFSAFSLVNVQLQWRDFQSGLNDDETAVELSIIQKDLPLEIIKTLSSDEKGQVVPSSPIITTESTVIPVCTYRTIVGKVHFTPIQNKQQRSTIAYILNCATHPLSA